MRMKAAQQDSKETAVKAQAQKPHETAAHISQPRNAVTSLLSLQRTHGNRYVQRLLNARLIQAKLAVSSPQDESEREADRVADQVMRMPDRSARDGGTGSVPTPYPQIQRACAACEEDVKRQTKEEEEEEGIHRQEKEEEEEEGLHRQVKGESLDREEKEEEEEEGLQAKRVNGHAPEVSPETQARIESLRGGGQPLPETARAFFEPRFGRDFSQVRIHTDAGAAESAQALSARAYTLGNDIVFGAGEYAPDSNEGKHLLAHELTHVVQQKQGRVQRLSVNVVSGHRQACGGYQRRWDFRLGRNARADGYIVQQIDFYERTAPCGNPVVRYAPRRPTLSFWEAWPVSRGSRLFSSHALIGFTDQSSTASRPNNSGVIKAKGTIKFFGRGLTGNLGDLGVAGTAAGWAPGGEPQSGVLPSTHNRPGWWGRAPREGPAQRLAMAKWNCCRRRGRGGYNRITFIP